MTEDAVKNQLRFALFSAHEFGRRHDYQFMTEPLYDGIGEADVIAFILAEIDRRRDDLQGSMKSGLPLIVHVPSNWIPLNGLISPFLHMHICTCIYIYIHTGV